MTSVFGGEYDFRRTKREKREAGNEMRKPIFLTIVLGLVLGCSALLTNVLVARDASLTMGRIRADAPAARGAEGPRVLLSRTLL